MLLISRRAVNLVVVELVLLHHLEASRRQRHLGIEVYVTPLGVHIGHAEKADIVVVAVVLRQRPLVLAHVPFADALCDVALLLEKLRHGDRAIETACLAIHWRAQDAVVEWVLPGMDGGAAW